MSTEHVMHLPSVCSGQSAVCGGGNDLEGRAQGVESSRWKLRGAGGELQQTGQLLLSETGHHCPEPLHHLCEDRESRSVCGTEEGSHREM